MAAPGANLVYTDPIRVWQFILKKLNLRMGGVKRLRTSAMPVGADGTLTTRVPGLALKNGAPATNTAADAPTGLLDMCYDKTNNDVYLCTAYTSTTMFTWTKIID